MRRIFLAVCVSFFMGSVAFAEMPLDSLVIGADAVVRVKPDKVVLNMAIISRGKNLRETKKTVSDIIKKSISYCRQQEIPEKNIGTNYIRISPEYSSQKSLSESYFEVEQSLSIILEDLSKYEDVVTALLDFGMNRIRSIEFQVTDLKKYRNEARRLAIAAAKERAEFLAAGAGIKLGRIRNISDQSRSFYPVGYASNVSQNMQQGGSSSDSDLGSLAPGMISIRADIVLTYEIK